MSRFGRNVRWQIDDTNGIKWTLFDADATANAQNFRYFGNFVCLFDIDAQFALAFALLLTDLVDGTVFFALKTTFVGFAFLSLDDRDPTAGVVGVFFHHKTSVHSIY
jgi:hypothetical protein